MGTAAMPEPISPGSQTVATPAVPISETSAVAGPSQEEINRVVVESGVSTPSEFGRSEQSSVDELESRVAILEAMFEHITQTYFRGEAWTDILAAKRAAKSG